ncbi:MAG: DUF4340 domain-containing protein [Kiloniellales bacterium]|nr:DUF4340 domain-containing protein [Kiloniellales bacterium]
MTIRGLFFLFLVAAISVTGAFYSLSERPAVLTAGTDNEPAFPLLRSAPDAVAEVSFASREGRFSLLRQEAGWTAPDRDNFPADGDKIARVVAALSDMRLVAEKTSRKDLFSRLELDDPSINPESRAKRLVLKDKDGNLLVDAYFGKKRWRPTGSERSGTYLRLAGEDTTWLASGGEVLEPFLKDWLEDDVLDIRAEELLTIEISPAGGTSYKLTRDSLHEPFILPDLPPGRSVAASALNRLAGTLAALKHQDVLPRAEVGLSELRDPNSLDQAVFVTQSGLKIALSHSAAGEENWIAIRVHATPEADDETWREAELLDARLSPWAFKIQGAISQRLSASLEDFLEPAPAN